MQRISAACIVATTLLVLLLASAPVQGRLLRAGSQTLPGPSIASAALRSLMGEMGELKKDAPALDAAWGARELPKPRDVRVSSDRGAAAASTVYGYASVADGGARMNGPIQMGPSAWEYQQQPMYPNGYRG